jgi:hypothetical protein
MSRYRSSRRRALVPGGFGASAASAAKKILAQSAGGAGGQVRSLPAEITTGLNGEMNAVLKAPEFVDRPHTLGHDSTGGPPRKFAQVMAADAAKWVRRVRERRIGAD